MNLSYQVEYKHLIDGEWYTEHCANNHFVNFKEAWQAANAYCDHPLRKALIIEKKEHIVDEILGEFK